MKARTIKASFSGLSPGGAVVFRILQYYKWKILRRTSSVGAHNEMILGRR